MIERNLNILFLQSSPWPNLGFTLTFRWPLQQSVGDEFLTCFARCHLWELKCGFVLLVISFPFSTPHLFVSVTWVPAQEKDIQNACDVDKLLQATSNKSSMHNKDKNTINYVYVLLQTKPWSICHSFCGLCKYNNTRIVVHTPKT